MLIVYSEQHRLRDARTELCGGELVAPFECPVRAEYVLERIKETGLGEIIAPQTFGLEPIYRIHDRDYIVFLQTCWSEWHTAGYRGEAIPSVWPARGMRQKVPRDIEGKLGYYAMAAETSITEHTWAAAQVSANVALTAQQHTTQGARSAFALCRPPGHHAAADLYGGYCFLNNAAISAQAFLDQGAQRVAILDVDFHHGNGTQAIFYERSDVLFLSLHGHPQDAFPHFLGYGDEIGRGAGVGYNLNYPLPPGTDYAHWSMALENACQRIADYSPDALMISLGVDTFKGDPISFFKLDSDDFKTYGYRIADLRLPTLFIMEGGYAVEEIGINTLNVLMGFES